MGVKPITAKAAKSCAANTMAKQTGEVQGSKYSEADVIIDTVGGQNIFGTRDVIKEPDTPGTDATESFKTKSIEQAKGGKQATDINAYLQGLYKRFGDNVTTQELIDKKYISSSAAADYDAITRGANKGIKTITPGTEGKKGKEIPKTTPDYEEVDGMTVYNMRRDARREKVAERMANQAARQAARLRKRENRLNDRKKYEKAERIGKKAARRETREKKMQERLDQFDVQRKQGKFGSRDYRTLKVGESEQAFAERQKSYQNPDRTYGTDITDLERAKTFVGKSGRDTAEFVKTGIGLIFGRKK
jgi:hypothetical protein